MTSGVSTSSMPAAAAASSAEQPLLAVIDLAVSFDVGSGRRVQAVAGVSMTIFLRQTLAVVGESGCGKSVTAMSLMHLIPRPPGRFDRGSAVFVTRGAATDLLAMTDAEIRDIRGNEIAMIFQEPMSALNPVFSVGEQIVEAIEAHQRVRGREAKERALQAMANVRIPDPSRRFRQYPHQFSGGMRQRIMIAMVLACGPRLLLADEPTTALDVTVQAQILDLLRDLQTSRDMSMMLITHDLGIVAENADVVCVMYAGRVVEYAEVGELFSAPLHPYTRGLLACIPKLGESRERLKTIAELMSDGASLRAPVAEDVPLIPWWPEAPNAAREGGHRSMEYRLLEVRPDHWVGVWNSDEAARYSSRVPAIPRRTISGG